MRPLRPQVEIEARISQIPGGWHVIIKDYRGLGPYEIPLRWEFWVDVPTEKEAIEIAKEAIRLICKEFIKIDTVGAAGEYLQKEAARIVEAADLPVLGLITPWLKFQTVYAYELIEDINATKRALGLGW